MSALRKGMRIGMGNVLANPESFLRAHRESEQSHRRDARRTRRSVTGRVGET